MMRLPPWCSAGTMFVRYRVRSFMEVMPIVTYGPLERVESKEYMIILSLNCIDASVVAAETKIIYLFYNSPETLKIT